MRAYGSVKDVSVYVGRSEKPVRLWLDCGLRHTRPLRTGQILIKYEWVDDFLEKFEVRNRIREAAEEMLGEWEAESGK